MSIEEIQALGTNAIGKFSYDRLIRSADALMLMLKSAGIIQNYTLDAYADRLIRGKVYFNISVT